MIQSIQNIHLHKKETNPEPKQRDGYFITSKIADDIFVSKEKEASKGKKKYGIIILLWGELSGDEFKDIIKRKRYRYCKKFV